MVSYRNKRRSSKYRKNQEAQFELQSDNSGVQDAGFGFLEKVGRDLDRIFSGSERPHKWNKRR